MRLISLLFLVVVFSSCKKEVVEEPEVPVQESLSNGMVVLCEGLFQQNNSTASWIELSSGGVNNALFELKANRSLGDTGNDMKRYGGKVYIVVNVSSTVEVVDAKTFTPVQQIVMENSGVSKQPRYIAFSGSKAFVSCYDGYVDVIDTASLTVEQRIQVGANPEGLAVSNGKLYVANSGGLNAVMDSTVSVVDLISGSELYKITVGLNPGDVHVDANGDIYVITRGDYGATPPRMVKIDSQTDLVVVNFGFDASNISDFGTKFLISYYNFGTQQSSVSLFDPSIESIENASFIDMSNVTTLYGVEYNSFNGRIYVMDAMGFTNSGYIRAFDQSGNYLQSYHVGLNPTSILFYE